jgi:hypothetical protein
MGLDDDVVQHISEQIEALRPSTLKQVVIAVTSMASTCMVVAGIIWALARPAALEFIDQAITDHHLATQDQVANVATRVDRVEDANRDQDRALNAAAAHTAAQDEKLSNIQQLLTEQRSDIKELLKEAKSR